MLPRVLCSIFFFFNDTATTEIYTLSLHDALPICGDQARVRARREQLLREGPQHDGAHLLRPRRPADRSRCAPRSEEHTSELQSPDHLVCRLLLEKKKTRVSKLQRTHSPWDANHRT